MEAGASVEVATVLCQWAAGGLAWLWVTTRRREVGLGYGWLLRSIYGAIAVAAGVTGAVFHPDLVRDLASFAMAAAAFAALGRSVTRAPRRDLAAFDPRADLAAPVLGLVGVVAAGIGTSGDLALATHLGRLLVGTAFLGVVSDAMLLGHWYLVQPGLRRDPLRQLIGHLGAIWPLEVGLLLLPTGMIAVLTGTIDDGYGGLLGWFWVACAIATAVLAAVAMAALRERQYAAVMAATGLLYLAILTGFGTDLVARLTLAG